MSMAGANFGGGSREGGGGVAAAAEQPPIKPFRVRPPKPISFYPDVYRLLKLEERHLLRLGLGIGLYMALIIAGQIFMGARLTYMLMVPAVLGIIVVAARDQWTALLLYLGYAAMEGMFKYLSSFSMGIYIIAPGLLGIIALAWGLSRRTRAVANDTPPMSAAIAMFAIISLVQSFNPSGSGVVSSIAAAFLWYIGPALMYLVTCTTVRSTRQLYSAFFVLLAVGTIVSAFALVQQQMGRGWTYAHLPGYETTLEASTSYTSFRPASTTSIGGGAAIFAHFAIVSGLVLLLAPNTKTALRVAIACAMAVNGVALVLAGVRAFVIIDLLCIMLFLILNARSPREIARSLGAMVAVVAMFFLVTKVGQNMSGGKILGRYTATLSNPLAKFQEERGSNVTYLIPMIAQAPLGVGFQRGLGSYTAASSADTIVSNRETQLNCWQSDLGLPGLLTGIVMVSQSAYMAWRCFRTVRAPHLRPFAVMLFVIVVTYLPGCLAGPALQAAVNFWVVVGLAAILHRVEREEDALINEAIDEAKSAATKGGLSDAMADAQSARARAARLPMVRG